jgi:hypothetical protein
MDDKQKEQWGNLFAYILVALYRFGKSCLAQAGFSLLIVVFILAFSFLGMWLFNVTKEYW